MSYQEKSVVASLVSALIVFAFYALYVFGIHQEGRLVGPDASSLVGKSSFVLMVATIAVTVVVQVALSVIHTAVTKESETILTDEREQLIALKSMQVSSTTFSLGFLASMGILAFEVWAPYAVFLLIITSMFVGMIAGYIAKLILYRRGY